MSTDVRRIAIRTGMGIFTASLLTCMLIFSNLAQANPQNGTVIAGNVSIQQSNPNTLLINQSSNKAIINWQSFNIAANERTFIQQPSSSAIILNRIVGGDPSKIYGQLSANGQVVLVNPAGIYFGPTARINVASLITTTADIRNNDFLNGNYHFVQAPDSATFVINEGEIKAAAGLVVLVAPAVKNSGVIQANLGKVALASGNEFTVDLYGDQMINFVVSNKVNKIPTDMDGKPLDAAVTNTGSIIADGGKILITANVAQNVVQNVINMEGIAQARTVAQKAGEIILSGGDEGVVKATGKLDVSGKQTGQKGGAIKVLGQNIKIAKATIDASGDAGGGLILIGGNYQGKGPEVNAKYTSIDKNTYINASALTSGDGGRVIVWSDDATDYQGSILATGGAASGNGGFAEVSGKRYLSYKGSTDLTAPHGKIGQLLLDPYNVVIASQITIDSSNLNSLPDTSVIETSSLANALATANIIIQTSPDGLQAGDVTFLDNLSWSSNTTLSIYAYRDIIIENNVTVSNAHGGSLILRADSTGTGIGSVAFPNNSCMPCGKINFSNGGSVKIYYNPTTYNTADEFSDFVTVDGGTFTAYMLINNANQLQDMHQDDNYALAKNIDASSISNFNPIENFSGKFDGNNYTISGLKIERPSLQQVGLFGIASNATIENVQIINADITGGETAGILAGLINNTIVSNVATSGNVNAVRDDGIAGGLVGASKNDSLITLSHSSATVTGGLAAGGLVGANGIEERAALTQSYSTGIVNGLFAGGLVGVNLSPGSVISQSYSTADVIGDYAGGLVGHNFTEATVTDSFSLGSVAGSLIQGGLIGINEGNVNNAYSIGYIYGNAADTGGLIGSNTGTVSNSFWNKETSGQQTSAGGIGATTSELQTGAFFTNAGWNLSGIWEIVEEKTYPFLTNISSAPRIISGRAYTDQGVNSLGANQALTLVSSNGTTARIRTMANGAYYYFASQDDFSTDNLILAYIEDSMTQGNAIGGFSGNTIAGLDIYGNTVTVKSGTNPITNSQILALKNNNPEANALYSGSGNNLNLNNGVNFRALAGPPFVLAGSINGTADIIFDSAVNLAGDASITTTNGNLIFNSTLDGAHNLTLNIPAGDILFAGSVGSNTRLNNLVVQNVHDLTVQQTLKVNNYHQAAGSGTSNFGNHSLNALNQIVITTAIIQGHIQGNNVSLNGLQSNTANINAITLTLGGNHANLTGFINGVAIPANQQFWATNFDNSGIPEIILSNSNGVFTLNGYNIGGSSIGGSSNGVGPSPTPNVNPIPLDVNLTALNPTYLFSPNNLSLTDFYSEKPLDSFYNVLLEIIDETNVVGAQNICLF